MSQNATQTSQPASLFSKADSGESERDFREKFDELPFLFEHRLSEDSRFSLDSIRALALRLPSKVFLSGNLTIEQGFQQRGAKTQTFDQALDRLEEAKSWIILKKVYEDAEYRPVLRQCLQEVQLRTGRSLEPLIESQTMSLILSSPEQVTPYHVDADCNFLFQIHGRKTFYVFNGRDRSVLPETEEESFWAGDINAARYREETQSKAWAFDMKPGNGVHVPVMFPHWVKNGNNVSISLSINFRFHGRIRGNAYRMNHFMRKFGLRPRPVGQSKAADSVKALLFSVPRAGMQSLRRIRK